MKIIFKNIFIAAMIISSGLFSQVDPYVINSFDTAEQATDEGTDAFWTEYDETDETMNFSTLSHIDASQAPENDTPVMDYSYDFDDLAKYYKIYIDLMNFWKQKFNSKIYNLSYENLVANKESEIKKLLNFCELDAIKVPSV